MYCESYGFISTNKMFWEKGVKNELENVKFYAIQYQDLGQENQF